MLVDIPENGDVPKVGGVSGSTVMEDNWEQPSKAYWPIVVVELPMIKPLRPLQPEKAQLPIEVTEFGMVSEPVKPSQLLKA